MRWIFRVSIHAPARGATASRHQAQRTGGFNPRARAGRDVCERCGKQLQVFQSTRPRGARRFHAPTHPGRNSFQSTRPRGARRKAGREDTLSDGFNPRARAGRDCHFGTLEKSCILTHDSANLENQPFKHSTLFRQLRRAPVPISRAKSPENSCSLLVRTTSPAPLPHHSQSSLRHAPHDSANCFPKSNTANYRSQDQ